MSIAFKIGDEKSEVNGIIYMDAVTVYTKDFKGRVTSYPVDVGVNIADHFIADNPTFVVEGVVTEADLSGVSDKISIANEKPINAKEKPDPMRIQTGGGGLLSTILPSAARQFLPRSGPTVLADTQVQFVLPKVEALLGDLMTGIFYNQVDKKWRNKMITTILYEMDGTNFTNARTDLVITGVSIKEDPDSGDALVLSISLEKVRFATLDIVEIKNVKDNQKKKVASTANKGKPGTEEGNASSTSANKPSGLTNTLFSAIDVARGK